MQLITNIRDKEWKTLLQHEFNAPYFKELEQFLSSQSFYPHKQDIFRSLNLTPPTSTKVVILGSSPYLSPYSDGLAFSANGPSIPDQLKEIYAEADIDTSSPDLTEWAMQGVLLLNTVLTIGKDGSPHINKGWEQFTNAVISSLQSFYGPIIFMLWGGKAKEKEKLITNPRHIVLKTSSKTFNGCNHFNEANKILINAGQKPIDWHIVEEHIEVETDWAQRIGETDA